MTAEIAIMNRSAIAVAADSAVTRGPNKVHINANKIFRLSDRSPVGLMVFGNADVFGLPWELVAKLYRSESGSKTFGTTVEWSDSFIQYLRNDRFLDSELANREIVTIAYYLATKIKNKCGGGTKKILTKEVDEEIDRWMNSVNTAGSIDGYDLPTCGSFSRLYAPTCKDVFTEVFQKRVADHVLKRFPLLVRDFSGSKKLSDYMSGFVIFGYGDDENDYIHENSVSTILSALDGLGKEDMANLAEALVELTALKLKVSRKTEVVGGPIDIALLSKVDGFIWIKRKHYFDPVYNPHFFKDYPTHKSRVLKD